MQRTILSRLIILPLVGIIHHAVAQGEYNAQMFNTPFLYNSAYSGDKELPSIYTVVRLQNTSIQGGQKQFNLAGQMPFKHNMGFGFVVDRYQAGALANTQIQALYSYKIKVDALDYFRFGINAGYQGLSLNLSGIQTPEETIAYATSKELLTGRLLAGLGLMYSAKEKFSIGVSFPSLSHVFVAQKKINNYMLTNMIITYKYSLANSVIISPIINYAYYVSRQQMLALGSNVSLLEGKIDIFAKVDINNQNVAMGVSTNVIHDFTFSLSYATIPMVTSMFGSFYEVQMGYSFDSLKQKTKHLMKKIEETNIKAEQMPLISQPEQKHIK